MTFPNEGIDTADVKVNLEGPEIVRAAALAHLFATFERSIFDGSRPKLLRAIALLPAAEYL